jgi:hypothetical protein
MYGALKNRRDAGMKQLGLAMKMQEQMLERIYIRVSARALVYPVPSND